MKKKDAKRHAHGVTSLMVLDALVKLHTRGGARIAVSRAELLESLPLPETTVDDRLRTLVKEGRVLRVGRALYEPKPWAGQERRRIEAPGTRRVTRFADGMVLVETWSSLG